MLKHKCIFYLTEVLLLVVAVSALAACGESAGETHQSVDKTVHPTPENIPADSAVADIIEMTIHPRNADKQLKRYARRLRKAEAILRIGTATGERSEVIGKVQDIVGGTDGYIYVLDSRYNEIKVYDPNGRFVRAVGKPGRGPSEFMYPKKMTQTGTGALVVAGRESSAEIFEVVQTRPSQVPSLKHAGLLTLGGIPEGMCALGDTLYFRGAAPTGIIHAYSEKTGHLQTFGKLYQSGSPFVQSQLSDGPIACQVDAQTLVTMFDWLPVVYAYAPTGKLKWKSMLSGFQPMKVVSTVNNKGRPSISYGIKGVTDVVKTLTAAPGGYVVIQIARRTPRSRQLNKKYAVLHTYLIDAATGEGVYVGDGLPPIYDITTAHIYAGVNRPFPQVKIYRLPTEGA